jgi:hypothetical protein
MLWWGVMTVTGVGWFLFGQIIIVVLFIGVGGPAILASLYTTSFAKHTDNTDHATSITMFPHPYRTGTSTSPATRPSLCC